MYLFIFVIYLILYVIIFFKVSKKNGSYFNSFTIGMGYQFLMQGVFFFLYALGGEPQKLYSSKVLNIFALSVLFGLIFQYIGYSIAYRKGRDYRFLCLPIEKKETRALLSCSIIFATFSFLLLAVRGVGLKEWLFNTRNAYIVGRAGNGMFYVLFMFFLAVALIALFYKWFKFKKRGLLTFSLLLLFCYLSGSKAFILGIIFCFIFFIDTFYKKFKIGSILFFGVAALICVNFLLMFQSNTTILSYVKGDFYFNYLNEIAAIENKQLSYFYGQLWFENMLYGWMPRNIFSFKPLIYGTSRLPAFFFGEESVIAGNTPSFGAYGVAYGDFGLYGVILTGFINGIIPGFIESSLRKAMKHRSFLPLALYCLFYFASLLVAFWIAFIMLFVYVKFIKAIYGNTNYRNMAIKDKIHGIQ